MDHSQNSTLFFVPECPDVLDVSCLEIKKPEAVNGRLNRFQIMKEVLKFHNVDETEGLLTLNAYLGQNSYIYGFHPTKLDCIVQASLDDSGEVTRYANITRWLRHITSYSAKERSQWETPTTVQLEVTRKNEKTPSKDVDDFDPFGEEDAQEKKAAAEISTTHSKAAKPKKVVINRSQLVIDIKPASIGTDMQLLERSVRSISMDGLEWSVTCKVLPIAFGLMKLQIGCVIIDDMINTDDIIERIECLGLNQEAIMKKISRRATGDEDDEDDEDEPEGMVQSAEIVSFNKL